MEAQAVVDHFLAMFEFQMQVISLWAEVMETT